MVEGVQYAQTGRVVSYQDQRRSVFELKVCFFSGLLHTFATAAAAAAAFNNKLFSGYISLIQFLLPLC